MKLTLQTFHYCSNAEKLIDMFECGETPPLRVRPYHRPGAPRAGIMTSALVDGDWMQVGWVRETDRLAVEELCSGAAIEDLVVKLREAYVKRGFCVLKLDVSLQ
ncbi:uncharacterized protein LOC144914992 [Branchiostoma floridae x Branchiostoma belcheri]|nr:hypothetical protein Bbelb_249520 [Branchiostoma belcheri]KAI8511486.1 hypothetical protein Bbelb_105860 [Branchiostoma belcheri]